MARITNNNQRFVYAVDKLFEAIQHLRSENEKFREEIKLQVETIKKLNH